MLPALLLAATVALSDSTPPGIPGYGLQLQEWGYFLVTLHGDPPPSSRALLPPPDSTSAAELLRRFLFDHPDVFGLDEDGDSLVFRQWYFAGKGRCVVLEQWHRGLRVRNTETTGLIDGHGRVAMVQGMFVSRIVLDPVPKITGEQAIEIASPRHPPVPGVAPRVEDACFLRSGPQVQLVYRVFLPRRGYPGYLVVVDANSGEVLGDMAIPPPER